MTQAPRRLADALPELVADLGGTLLNVGRPDLVRQLDGAQIMEWAYDEFADATFLYVAADGAAYRRVERLEAECLSLFDELGLNVYTDERGRLCGIEVLDGREVAERLEGRG